MPPSDPPPPPSRADDSVSPQPAAPGCWQPLTLGVAGFVVLVSVGIGLLVGRCSAGPGPEPSGSVTVLEDSPNVVMAVRDLARLESASYHMERVIDLRERQSRLFGLVRAEDAILLVAAGDVSAGVDLAQLAEGDVRIDAEAKSVSIVLPRAEVFSARLDSDRTYVHTRDTDLLAKRKEALETKARQEAERALEQAAKEGGILERAERNAERTVHSLVESLGYEEVTVTFSERVPRGG